MLRLLETFSGDELTHAIEDALELGTIAGATALARVDRAHKRLSGPTTQAIRRS